MFFCFYQLAEFFIFAFAVQHVNEAHHLLVGRFSDTKQFQRFVVNNITDICYLTSYRLRTEVNHHHLRIVTCDDSLVHSRDSRILNTTHQTVTKNDTIYQ